MSTLQLRIEGKVTWELDYHLPALWPWLFDGRSITESRRLHATAFSAAEMFRYRRERVRRCPFLFEITSIFERLEPEYFPREMGTQPDAVVSLDLNDLERQRPYVHEEAMEKWETFFRAAEAGNESLALDLWQQATLNPLTLYNSQQQDARSLSARALELGLEREDRGTALLIYLFGRPVSRPAVALNLRWVEAAQKLDAVGYKARTPWWARLFPS